jgi:hypothetical protein
MFEMGLTKQPSINCGYCSLSKTPNPTKSIELVLYLYQEIMNERE